jgi:hypothetical protein
VKWTHAIAALLVTLFVTAGCREQTSSEYVTLTGKVFIFNYRIAEANYVVTLGKVRPLAEGSVALASFENPAGGEPLTARQKVSPDAVKIVLESPSLSCVRKGRAYQITITIMDAGGKVLQRIDTTLTSSLDQDVLPDKPLVVGPVYTPNPELAGNPGGKTGEKKNCPE